MTAWGLQNWHGVHWDTESMQGLIMARACRGKHVSFAYSAIKQNGTTHVETSGITWQRHRLYLDACEGKSSCYCTHVTFCRTHNAHVNVMPA